MSLPKCTFFRNYTLTKSLYHATYRKHHCCTPRLRDLSSRGLSALLHEAGQEEIRQFTPKDVCTTLSCDFLFLMDECLLSHELEQHYRWKKLILLYSPNFELTATHLRQLKLDHFSAWYIEDLTARTLNYLLHLKENSHSNNISKRLLLPALNLNDFDLILIRGIADGLRNDKMAEQLHCSSSTIERHKRQLKERLGVEEKTDTGLLAELSRYGYRFYP